MNLKLVTLSSLKTFFSNLNSKLTGYTTSGKNYKLSKDSNGNYYTNVPWKGVTKGNDGISVTEGTSNYSVSAVPRTKVGNPTCPGYTYRNGYFIADNPVKKDNWYTAMATTANVTVTQNYNYGGAETRNAIARTLSREEVERWWNYGNGHIGPFWTSTLHCDVHAICCYGNGLYGTYYTLDGGKKDHFYSLIDNNVYICLGFKDPFSEEVVDDTNRAIINLQHYILSYSSCSLNIDVIKNRILNIENSYAKKNQFSFDSNNKILNISL